MIVKPEKFKIIIIKKGNQTIKPKQYLVESSITESPHQLSC